MSPVSYTPVALGQLSDPAQINTLYQDVATISGQVFNVKERTYGAQGDGSTDDAPAILAAVTAATSVGGGTVLLPPGVFGINGQVAIPAGVNVWGMGDGDTSGSATTFKCLNAAASLQFGARGTSSYGGVSGNFRVDGNALSTNPMYLGRTLGRGFQNITLNNSAAGGTLLLIEEAQNNCFFRLNLLNGRGDHIVFDRGAGSNQFFHTESSTAGTTSGVHVRFQATNAAPGAGLVAYPLNNQFWGGIFERDGGGLTSMLYQGAGLNNGFHAVLFAMGNTARTFNMVVAEIANAGITSTSTGLMFENCEFIDTSALGTALDLNGATTVELLGRTLLTGPLYEVRLRDTTSKVWISGRLNRGGSSTPLDPASTGVYQAQVRRREANPTEYHPIGVTANDAVHSVLVDGESNRRYELLASGAMSWGSGSAAFDTTLQRFGSSGVGGLSLDKPFRGLTSWGTAVVTKTAAYTTTLSDEVILCDATSGAFTVTLITAVGWPGKRYIIKRTSATNNVTADANGSQTIDGALTKTLGSQYAWIEIVSDGANWHMIASGGTVT